MIAKEGYPFIIAAAVIILVLLIVPKNALIVLFILLLALFVWFFRDPERVIPTSDGAVVSGADGKVIFVGEQEFEGKTWKKVSVFMNVFNVHVNRMPFTGKVTSIRHQPGKYMPADRPEASYQNEQNIFTVESDHGTYMMKQVAGLVARRTVSYVEVGDSVAVGERFGMIKFSSRVDHYLPMDFDVKAEVGDKTVAGETVIAEAPETGRKSGAAAAKKPAAKKTASKPAARKTTAKKTTAKKPAAKKAPAKPADEPPAKPAGEPPAKTAPAEPVEPEKTGSPETGSGQDTE